MVETLSISIAPAKEPPEPQIPQRRTRAARLLSAQSIVRHETLSFEGVDCTSQRNRQRSAPWIAAAWVQPSRGSGTNSPRALVGISVTSRATRQDAIGVGAASCWRGHHAHHRPDRWRVSQFSGPSIATVARCQRYRILWSISAEYADRRCTHEPAVEPVA
jgi:hypothetical protein